MKRMTAPFFVLLLISALWIQRSTGDGPYFKVLDSYWGSLGSPIEVISGDSNAQLIISVFYSGQLQITNPRLTLNLPEEFSNLTGGNVVGSAYQGTFGYGSKMDFTFRISVRNDAASGVHTCSALMDWATYASYYDTTLRQVVSQLSATWSENITVPIIVHAKPNLKLSIDPAFLTAGRSNNVTLLVANAGSAEIRNLELSISTGTGLALIGIDNKFYVPVISTGSVVSLDLNLFPSSSLASGMSQLTISASYRSAYGFSKSESRVLTIPVRGYSDVWIVSMIVPPSSSSRYIASGTVANTGMVTLRSLTISFEPTGNFSSQSDSFVGDVPVGAQSPYSLQLVAGNIRNGTYALTLILNYKDDFGIQTITKQTLYVEMTVLKPKTTDSSTSTESASGILRIALIVVPIALGVVVGLGVGYLLFRRRKSEPVE